MDSSPPNVDPLYIAARRVLLDALTALVEHRDAVVVVGAQAIYLHTHDADLDATVAPYTTDADLALNPMALAPEPQLALAMQAAGFILKIKSGGGGVEPGSWLASVDIGGQFRSIPVDLIVPGALAIGHGRRDARLPDHGRHAARWADGLEAAVIDHTLMPVTSLEPGSDPRRIDVRVAGMPALLIAKAYKLYERLLETTTRAHRIRSKDAGDIIRLMRGPMNATAIGQRLAQLAQHPDAGPSVQLGVQRLHELFAKPAAPGVTMAVTALSGALDEQQVRTLAPAFVTDTLAAYQTSISPEAPA